MTNRELCIQKISELDDDAIAYIVEEFIPTQSEEDPVYQSLCEWCHSQNGGECPAGEEEGCTVDVSTWMAAEAVPL